MALQRICPANREEWLAARKAQGIGASEAASIVGLSPRQSKLDLWEIKTGRKAPPDLSGNEQVERGVRMESAIRAVFQANHPELIVEHHAFDILFQDERPWLFATLDGEVADTAAPGKRYALEIKTAQPNGKAGWEKWSDGKIPGNYYAQILHQMLATGYEKVYVAAFLFGKGNDEITYREYEFSRDGRQPDLELLLREETEFWDYVSTDRKPFKFSIT